MYFVFKYSYLAIHYGYSAIIEMFDELVVYKRKAYKFVGL